MKVLFPKKATSLCAVLLLVLNLSSSASDFPMYSSFLASSSLFIPCFHHSFLRASYPYAPLQTTPIVILHPELPSESIWQLSQTLPFISFVKVLLLSCVCIVNLFSLSEYFTPWSFWFLNFTFSSVTSFSSFNIIIGNSF